MKTFHLDCNGASGDTGLEEDFAELLAIQFELFKRKQASYGPHNVGAFQERGIFVRVWDKVQRLRRLVWDNKPNPLNDENIEDTWMDLANYSIMAILCRRGQWPDYVENELGDN